MKKIHVFLASSINDLSRERAELGDYFRSLNDRFVDQGIYFQLHKCEDISDEIAATRKQDEYNEIIRNSDYFYVLFYHHAGQYTVEEFNVALDEFRSSGKPKITTFFHELSDEEVADESVKGFMERLENEIQHYYNIFSSIDTVKLKILMELALNPDNGISLELSDCELRMNDSIITNIHMENLPIYKKHDGIIRVRNQINKLEEEAIKAKQMVIEHPDDIEIDDRYYEARMNLVNAKHQLHEYEKQLLDASFSIVARTVNGKLYNKRTKEALTLFDLGKLDEALAVLDEEAFEEDLKKLDQIDAIVKERYGALIQEILTKIDILISKGVNATSELEIRKLYEKAYKITTEHNLSLDCIIDYIWFLKMQNDFQAAINVGKALYNRIKSLTNVEARVLCDTCETLAGIFLEMNHLDDAIELYSEVVTVYREKMVGEPAVYSIDLARCLNELGFAYAEADTEDSYKTAKDYHVEAFAICKKYLLDNPCDYTPELRISIEKIDLCLFKYTNKMNLSERVQNDPSRGWLFKEAIDIFQTLAEQNDIWQRDLAYAYGEYGTSLKIYEWDHTDAKNMFNSYSELIKGVEKAYKESLHIWKLQYEKDHNWAPELIYAIETLAKHYVDNGNTDGAKKEYASVLPIIDEQFKDARINSSIGFADLILSVVRRMGDVVPQEQKKILCEKAISIVEKLKKQNPNRWEPELARARLEVAKAFAKVNTHDSESMFKSAINIYYKLVEGNPRMWSDKLSNGLYSLARYYLDNLMYTEAEDYFKKSMIIAKKLIRNNPNIHKWSIYYTCDGLANCYKSTGRLMDVFSVYSDAISFYQELSASCRDFYDDLFDLYNDLIQFCVDEEKNNEAINAYKEVIEAEKKLVNTTEQHESYLHNLGLNCGSLASLYLSVGQIEDAKKWYFEGIKIFERLCEESGTWRRNWLSNQAALYCNIATIHLRNGEIEQAKEMYNKVLEIKIESEKCQTPDDWYDDYRQEEMQERIEQYRIIWEYPEQVSAIKLAKIFGGFIYPYGVDNLIDEAIKEFNSCEPNQRECCKQSLKELCDSLTAFEGDKELVERIRPYIE